MKILFIIPSLAQGGQEKIGMTLCNFLVQFHEVLVVCFEDKNNLDFDYKPPIKRINIPRKNNFWGKGMVVLSRIKELKTIKKEFQPTISIAFGETAALTNVLSFSKEKKLTSIHQSYTTKIKNYTLITLLRFIILKLSDIIVPVSKAINDELYSLFRIKNKLFVQNGYDLDYIRLHKNEPIDPSIITGSPVLIHVGRFSLQKNQIDLAKIFVLVKKHLPNAQLLLLGAIDGSDIVNKQIYENCIKIITDSGFTVQHISSDDKITKSDVIILGHQNNPYKYLSKSDLFVFPSLWEGFGNVLIEAMACGTPVISANCATGPEEILINDETNDSYGILLPKFKYYKKIHDFTIKENHHLWANTIVELFQNKEKIHLLQQQSFKRSEAFGLNKSCQKWLTIIETHR